MFQSFEIKYKCFSLSSLIFKIRNDEDEDNLILNRAKLPTLLLGRGSIPPPFAVRAKLNASALKTNGKIEDSTTLKFHIFATKIAVFSLCRKISG